MYVCMSHQSDWGCYKQPIKLLLLKVNHICENFTPILEWSPLFLYKQEQLFLYWSYFNNSIAVFDVVKPRTW